MEKTNQYLSHLDNSIPTLANNYMLSTYSIILEAWRRGLEIDISIRREATGNIEPYYTIKNGNHIHEFSATRGDKVSFESKEASKNKYTAKEYLKRSKVPTPEGKEFGEEINNHDIISYVDQELSYPVVVKPLNGSGGRGVISNIQNEQELIEALEYVRDKLNFPHVIIEKFFQGYDYRLYVIGDEVVAALKRLPANVVGDGKNSIEQLIKNKNKIRTKNPALSQRPIKVDEETLTLLNRKGLSQSSVPSEGEVIYLKSKSNVSSGGDSIDVTDEVSDNIKSIAISATKAFEDLPQAGVDLIVNEEQDNGIVIELNSRAHITQHLYPLQGLARDVPKKIVDFYFPETKDQYIPGAFNLYIDFDFIYNSCLSRSAKYITIPPLPNKEIVLKRYTISSIEYNEAKATRIRRLAYNQKVNGYIKLLSNGNISIVVGAPQNNINKFEKSLKRYLKKVSPNARVIDKPRKSPVKHGFTIEGLNEDSPKNSSNITDDYFKKYSNLKNDHQKLVRKLAEFEQREKYYNLMEKQNKNLKKQLKQMENSTSWKVTKPLRKAIKIVKK